jgi:transposase
MDPYREHLRKRRAEDPAVPILQLLTEIKALGYTGSQNLLYRYITQGRVESERSHLSPRRVTRLLVTKPENLSEKDQQLVGRLTATCPEMTALIELTGAFAQLLQPAPQNAGLLDEWITAVRAADLPHLQAFTRGLDFDKDAVQAALTLPFHNGGTEGVNTKTKRIMRQMHGRAGFELLRHRILLG